MNYYFLKRTNLFKKIIKEKLKNENEFDNEFVEACYNGNIEKVKFLIKDIKDINLISYKFGNLLLKAVFFGDECGVESHKSMNGIVGDICEYTPLIAACQSGNIKLVKFLIDNGANVNKSGCVYHVPPLVVACIKGNENIVRNLINYNIDNNGVYYEVSPLSVACINRHEELVSLLLESREIDINEEEEFFSGSALAFACKENHNNIAKLLIKYGADITKKADIVYDNALSIVVDGDCKNIEGLLLRCKAKDVKRAECTITSLEIATEKKNSELITVLSSEKVKNIKGKQI